MAKVDILNYISDSNILRSTYDTDTNELDITDVPQNLNSVITLGGGSPGNTKYEELLDIIADNYTGIWENDDIIVNKHLTLGASQNVTEVILPNMTSVPGNFLYNNNHVTRIYMPKLIEAPMASFGYLANANLNALAFQSLKTIGDQSFRNGKFSKFDMLGASDGTIGGSSFIQNSNLNVLVIRADSVTPLSNINAFNSTPFASGGAGGTIYVPSAQISSYQAASNWSTILGYANNSIQAIEGSIYENEYADGTPIGG